MLLPRYAGRPLSIESIVNDLQFSPEAPAAVRQNVANSLSWTETFVFDATVFSNTFRYRSVLLENGAMVSADAAKFDDVIETETEGGNTVFKTKRSKIVNEKIVKQRSGLI